jgi:hypothetical protein
MESSPSVVFDASSQYTENFYLSEEQAAFRFAHVSDVCYDACLALPKGDKFFGHITIKFNLSSVPSKSLPLDFRGLKIARLSINSQLVENKEGDG